MKKIEFTEEQIKNIIIDYTINIIGTPTISEKYNVSKPVINKLLKANGIKIDTPGQRFKGGKSSSYKRNADKHRDKKYAYHKEWYEENKENVKEYLETYRIKNIDKIRETKRKYERKRKSSDPIYKLIGNFRTAIYTVLKEQNVEKSNHYFEMLGYKPIDLIEHLEKQFNDGMTWENYGEWHVDHKKPITAFTFENTEDLGFKECWSLNNLQPLWGSENISKGNKILR